MWILGGRIPRDIRCLIDLYVALCRVFMIRAARRKTRAHGIGDEMGKEVTVHPGFAALR
jgi:hypothetical protein